MKYTPTPRKIIIKFKNQFIDKQDGLRIDTTFNPEHHIRISAEVFGVPIRYEGDIIGHKYLGAPSPRPYSSKRRDYSLYYHETTFYTVEDDDINISVGDTIYFHFLAIQYEQFDRQSNTFIKRDEDGFEYHQISVDNLIAVVKEEGLQPLLGRVLVKSSEFTDDELNLHGFRLLKGKKYLEGIVRYNAKPIKDQTYDISPGDEIIFLKGSEFENDIEGEKLFVMRQWFVVAKKVNGEWQPVGDYIKIDKLEETGFKMENNTTTMTQNGKVVALGERADKELINQEVIFNNRSSYFVAYNEKTIFVRDCDVYGIKWHQN